MYLVIRLYAIPEGLDQVVFDLHWGFPSIREDFLDATCFLFSSHEHLGIVDYTSKQLPPSLQLDYIKHSGDVMDKLNKQGHHKITLSVKQIPIDVTHLFFTLSSWHSANIAKYPNPSLKFYEVKNPNNNLCETTLTRAASSQAVVMCSLSRDQYDVWNIYQSGKLSTGNAKHYDPLINTIQSLIRQGY